MLSELFKTARLYGRVYIHTCEDGDYSCSIKFNSIEHTKLEAHSGYDCKSPEEAVSKAIEKAIEIVTSLNKDIPEKTIQESRSLLYFLKKGK